MPFPHRCWEFGGLSIVHHVYAVIVTGGSCVQGPTHDWQILPWWMSTACGLYILSATFIYDPEPGGKECAIDVPLGTELYAVPISPHIC